MDEDSHRYQEGKPNPTSCAAGEVLCLIDKDDSDAWTYTPYKCIKDSVCNDPANLLELSKSN